MFGVSLYISPSINRATNIAMSTVCQFMIYSHMMSLNILMTEFRRLTIDLSLQMVMTSSHVWDISSHVWDISSLMCLFDSGFSPSVWSRMIFNNKLFFFFEIDICWRLTPSRNFQMAAFCAKLKR
jgi:hypothetical protein